MNESHPNFRVSKFREAPSCNTCVNLNYQDDEDYYECELPCDRGPVQHDNGRDAAAWICNSFIPTYGV